MNSTCCHSMLCITPPHILRHMAQSKDKAIREAGLSHLAIATRIATRRTFIGLVPASASTGVLSRSVFDAQHTPDFAPQGPLVRKEGDLATGDDDVNRAYDGLGATYELYHDKFGRNSIDGKGMPLNAFVHVNTGWDNAQWDGRQMLFGDGDRVVFGSFTAAIDIIGHELTHGVTQHTANLAYHDQPGALNESFSDVFGSIVKQYSLSQTVADADWLIGAGIFMPGVNGEALRSMADPGSAYNDPRIGKDPQPKHWDKYDPTTDDFGGVHINSGIPNHAFYLFATALGGSAWEDAGLVWYETLKALTPESQFQDCADKSYQIAIKYGKQQAIDDAWRAVGIAVNKGATLRKSAGAAAAGAASVGGMKKQFDRVLEEMRKLRELLPS